MVSRGLEFLLDGRRKHGLMVLPTAFGKSLVLANIAQQLDGPVVIFQPSAEILAQNEQKFQSYGFDVAIHSASMRKREFGSVVLATIGSVKGYPDIFADFPYCIVDEAHYVNPKEGMYKDFFAALGDTKILGLTATPWRLHSGNQGTQAKFLTRTLPKVFQEVVGWVQVGEMVEDGYWSKLEYWPVAGFKKSKIPLNATGADFDGEALQLHLWETHWERKDKTPVHFPDKLTEIVTRLLSAGRKHVLVFTSFVQESEYLVAQMGGKAAIVTAKTPPTERELILNSFKAGRLPVVTNVGILGTGYDFPELDTIVLARPTMSLALHCQQIGRGVRLAPGKDSCWIIDMVEAVNTFGRVENLMLYCEGSSKWSMWGKPGDGKEVQLTNKYLGGDALRGCCPKCHAPKSLAFYTAKGKWLPVSRPPAGSRATLIVEQIEGKPHCRMVRRDDPDADRATVGFHFSYCDKFRAMRELNR